MKIIEMNKLMSFRGVNQKNFPSILRRSLVWKPKGRFVDPDFLEQKYPGHEKDGVFPKDPTLKRRLASGPYIAAALRAQYGFESRTTRRQCAEAIENYAALGGDGGLTEDMMRKACGLAIRERQQEPAHVDAGLAALVDSSQEKPEVATSEFQIALDALTLSMLNKKQDAISAGLFKYVWMPKGSPNMDKESLYEEMKKRKMLVPIPAAIAPKKGQDFTKPFIVGVHALADKIPIACPTTVLELPETHNLLKLQSYLYDNPARLVNHGIIRQYLEDNLKKLRVRGRGKVSNDIKSALDTCQKTFDKFIASEAHATRFLDHLQQAKGAKRRRLDGKKSDPQQSQSEAPLLVPVKVSYHYTLDGLVRTRRQADQLSVQSATRRVLAHVASHTHDIDIENCMFVILDQMVTMLEVPMPDDLRSVNRSTIPDSPKHPGEDANQFVGL